MVSTSYGKPNMLLTGMVMKSPDEMQALRWQSQLVVCLAFTGAFIWSAQNIIRRLITGDLTPGAYYSAALRIVFASLLSLMLSYTLETLPTAGYTRELLPAIAFISGMLPDNTFRYMKERISTFIETGMKASHDLPLEMIEGINVFHKLRLGEVGIDNAQNLAESNLIELILKTPFNPSQLITLACAPVVRSYVLETDLPPNPVKYKYRVGNSVCQLSRLMEHNLRAGDTGAVTVSEKLRAGPAGARTNLRGSVLW